MNQEKKTCSTCHNQINHSGHLCDPVDQEGKSCDWCGAQVANERHMCKDKVGKITHVCNDCGRTAVMPDLLCDPAPIE